MSLFYQQHAFNVGRSDQYVADDALPTDAPAEARVRYIAYYLPQFHPISENNRWWGPGFTEWTNVTKALPRYLGHLQPRLPADLGFYDLRQVDALRQQAALARRAGVHGFCIHHYWFSGHPILETPLRILLDNPDIDLPFCLNWANENWTRRWDGRETDVLLAQRYDPEDDLAFMRSILPALRDPRYIRVAGRPLIMVYRPDQVPDMAAWAERWRAFLIGEGVGDPYLVMPQVFGNHDPRPYGFDAAAGFAPHCANGIAPIRRSRLHLLDHRFAGQAFEYADLPERILANQTDEYRLFPGVCPGWDNEARRPGRSMSYTGASPALYEQWLRRASDIAATAAEPDERIVFINAWNEWAEGAVLEPDRHFGHAHLAATRRTCDSRESASFPAPVDARPSRGRFDRARPSWTRVLPNIVRRYWDRLARHKASA